MLIVRLIAEAASLSATLDRLTSRLGESAITIDTITQNDGITTLALNTTDVGAVRAALNRCATDDGAFFDMLIANHMPRVPNIFISDMDSTMIGQECIDELADYAGIKPQIAEITERAMRGELDFPSALRERVGLLAGLDVTSIDQCLAERISPMAGARALVDTLKSHGCRTVLVTGGFHHFADPVAKWLGFDHVVANRLDIANGKLTGKLVGPICDSSTKYATLSAEVAALNAAGSDAISLATGDGANDIPMIEAATYGIGYHAKPKARASANGWIDHGDLTNVLRLLGIAPLVGPA